MKKRISSLVLSMVMLIALFPATMPAYAATSGTCGDNLEWTLDDNGTLTITGIGDMYTFDWGSSPWYDKYIVRVIVGDRVTSIGESAFFECHKLKGITIPNSVTSIGESAFYGCCELTDITIPNSVTSIGKSAFFACSGLTDITIPNSVTSIGDYAFEECDSLTSITISNNVTSIGESAFYYCVSLTSIRIPESIISIGDYAFGNCENLRNVYYNGTRNQWDSIQIGEYNDELTSAMLHCAVLSGTCGANLKWVLYDEGTLTITGSGELSADSYPWYSYRDDIKNVVIENGVTSIGSCAFECCINLESVTIPESVTSIESEAFYECESLTSIYINDIRAWCNIDFEGGWIFPYFYSLYVNGNLVEDLVIPDGVTSISEDAFIYCTSLKSITIPDSVTSIGSGAFHDCLNLKSVYISDLKSWCNIDFEALHANPLWPGGDLYINGTLVENLIIPDGVEKIKPYAFFDCNSLTCVTIPDSVASIEEEAFFSCVNLKKITIPNSVTSIGEGAFNYDSGLENVYYNGTQEQWNSIKIGTGNSYLTEATKIFKEVAKKTYKFVTNCSAVVEDIIADYIAEAPVVTEKGREFIGWYDNAELSGDAITFPYYGDATTLYAKWNLLSDTIVKPDDFFVDAGYEYESYTVYEKDFNTEDAAPFYGTDLDIATKPTRWEYVDVEEGNKAIKVTYDPDYTESKYGWIGVTSDKGAFSADAEAYVLSFDVYFPSIPEYGSSVNFWNALKQGGGRKVQNVMMNYQDIYDEEGTLVEEGDTFGFNLGGELYPIEAETWYNCIQVIDIENRYVHYYINGEKFVTVDIAEGGELTDRGYLRVVYSTKGMEDGFLLDNIHAYEAQKNVPEVPFQYCVSGPALDFEGYSFKTVTSYYGAYLLDEKGEQATQLGQTFGLSSADKMSIVADPADANNTVMKWDNTNGDAAADIYANISTASKYAIKDKENNAIAFSYDVYVEDADTLGTMQPFWFTAYTPVRAHRQPSLGKSTKADCATISYGGKSTIFAEKEWHNVKLVYEMGTNVMTLYLDDVAFYDGSLENGPYNDFEGKLIQESGFRNLDYLRIQMGKTAKGVVYFDNLHIYEASNTACAISAPDYVAGVSKVGDIITIYTESYVEGEETVIQMSTDGKNWADFSDSAATLTSESVYYRSKAGKYCSEPIVLQGVPVPKPIKRADIFNIDFEGYAVDPKATNPEALNFLVDAEGNQVKNPDGGGFTFKSQVSTVKKNEEGKYEFVEDSYRTTEVVAAPTGYANADGIGQEALKVAGNGYNAGALNAEGVWATSAPSQLLINLASGSNRYPGGTTANTIAQEGDIYVTEFDYAIDEIPASNIQIAEFRSDAKWGRYCSLWLTTDGKIKLWNLTSNNAVISPKTWHKIRVVAYSATGTVEAYVDGVLVATVTSDTGSLGYWDSFRLYGGQTNPATSELVYYDNMNFYIAQLGYEVPEEPDVPDPDEPDPDVPEEPEIEVHGIYGDVFRDGFIDDFDWMIILNHVAGEIIHDELGDNKSAMFKAADVNRDGKTNDFDWITILNHITGSILNSLLGMEF